MIHLMPSYIGYITFLFFFSNDPFLVTYFYMKLWKERRIKI